MGKSPGKSGQEGMVKEVQVLEWLTKALISTNIYWVAKSPQAVF